jgi:hypothetical protein
MTTNETPAASGEIVAVPLAVPLADLMALRRLRSQLPGGDQTVFDRLFSRIPGGEDAELVEDAVAPHKTASTAIPDRIAVDAKGCGWRVWEDQDHWSMVPTNPDNSPIPEPVTWFVPVEQVGWLRTGKHSSRLVHDHAWDDPEWRSPFGSVVTTRIIHEHAACEPVFRATQSDRSAPPTPEENPHR